MSTITLEGESIADGLSRESLRSVSDVVDAKRPARAIENDRFDAAT